MASLATLGYAAHVAALASVSVLVNKIVPEPYLDEVFHIPQAQAYCAGQSEYNAKITTPPGLYLPVPALHHLTGLACSASSLRLTNLVLVAALPLLLYRLGQSIHGSTKGGFLEALTIAQVPVVWFFAFLYYTDVASLFFVLLCYDTALRKSYALSSIIGVLSLLFRQTNIIWVSFVAGVALVRELRDRGLHDPPLAQITGADVSRCADSAVTTCSREWRCIVRLAFVYSPVWNGFLAFVKWNGGVALGDKSNHVAALHFPQVFYFTAFAAIFSSPVWFGPQSVIQSFSRLLSSGRRALSTLEIGLLMGYLVLLYTYEHPFLKADNRHYTFYVWRRVIRRHISVRFLAVIPYMLGGSALWGAACEQSSNTLLTFVLYVLATCLALVPTSLIEPRYYILPYILLRLHLRSSSKYRLALELVCYTAVNAITMHVFLYKPFEWDSEPGLKQRFMW